MEANFVFIQFLLYGLFLSFLPFYLFNLFILRQESHYVTLAIYELTQYRLCWPHTHRHLPASAAVHWPGIKGATTLSHLSQLDGFLGGVRLVSV